MRFEKQAAGFCAALKTIANDDFLLENFECYLSRHFDVWMEEYANTPDGLTSEMMQFASIQ